MTLLGEDLRDALRVLWDGGFFEEAIRVKRRAGARYICICCGVNRQVSFEDDSVSVRYVHAGHIRIRDKFPMLEKHVRHLCRECLRAAVLEHIRELRQVPEGTVTVKL